MIFIVGQSLTVCSFFLNAARSDAYSNAFSTSIQPDPNARPLEISAKAVISRFVSGGSFNAANASPLIYQELLSVASLTQLETC